MCCSASYDVVLEQVDLQCLWLEHLDLGPETSTTVTVHVNGSSNAARPENAKPQVGHSV